MKDDKHDIRIGNWGCLSLALGIFVLWNMERLLAILEAFVK